MSLNHKDIAKLAGVSPSTVSKAFSGSHEIPNATREHIFAIARENGVFDKYNKNKYEKKIIGVMIPEFKSNYYKLVVEALEKEFMQFGAIVNISSTGFSAETEHELFNYYSFYCKADALIIIDPISEIYNPLHIPVVEIQTAALMNVQTNITVIRKNDLDAMRALISVLKEKGHTKIGFAGCKLTACNQNNFINAMKDLKMTVYPELIKTSGKRFEDAGIDCVEQWIADNTLPTAIFAAYDEIAIGIYKALNQHGFSIPNDVSVCGMNEIPEAPYMLPSLSSISPQIDAICRRAVYIIKQKLKNQYYSPREEITFFSEPIVRDSIGKAPAKISKVK